MRTRMLVTHLLVALAAAIPMSAGASPDSGYLGVRMQSIEGGLAEALDMEENSGVLLGQVVENSPAAAAGLASGDIVVAIDGTKVDSPSALSRAVRDHEPGDEIELAYLRGGSEKKARITLGEMAERRPARRHARVHDLRIGRDHGFLGVVTQPLGGDLGEYFGVENGEGALVAEVVEESPAAELGLQAGDVIKSIDGELVGDPDELRRVVGNYEEETEVEVVWVRDRREKSGKTTLEVREGLGVLGLPGMPHHGLDIAPLRRHVGDGLLWLESEEFQETIDKALEGLRVELDEIRSEIKTLREESRAD